MGMMIGLWQRKPNGKYKQLATTFGDRVPAGIGEWTWVLSTNVPQPAGQYQWSVSPMSVVRDRNGYFCIPAIVVKKITVK